MNAERLYRADDSPELRALIEDALPRLMQTAAYQAYQAHEAHQARTAFTSSSTVALEVLSSSNAKDGVVDIEVEVDTAAEAADAAEVAADGSAEESADPHVRHMVLDFIVYEHLPAVRDDPDYSFELWHDRQLENRENERLLAQERPYTIRIVTEWIEVNDAWCIRAHEDHPYPLANFADVTGQPTANVPLLDINQVVVEITGADDKLLEEIDADPNIIRLWVRNEYSGESTKEDSAAKADRDALKQRLADKADAKNRLAMGAAIEASIRRATNQGELAEAIRSYLCQQPATKQSPVKVEQNIDDKESKSR